MKLTAKPAGSSARCVAQCPSVVQFHACGVRSTLTIRAKLSSRISDPQTHPHRAAGPNGARVREDLEGRAGAGASSLHGRLRSRICVLPRKALGRGPPPMAQQGEACIIGPPSPQNKTPPPPPPNTHTHTHTCFNLIDCLDCIRAGGRNRRRHPTIGHRLAAVMFSWTLRSPP